MPRGVTVQVRPAAPIFIAPSFTRSLFPISSRLLEVLTERNQSRREQAMRRMGYSNLIWSLGLHAAVLGSTLTWFARPPLLGITPGSGLIEVGLRNAPNDEKSARPRVPRTSLPRLPRQTSEVTSRESNPNSTFDSGQGADRQAQPHYLLNPAPPYPLRARILRQEGVVYILVDVARDGSVRKLRINRSSGSSLLDDSAITTVQGWKFQPALAGGVPVEATVEVPVLFQLEKS